MPRLLDRFPFAKLVTIFAITFGVALGACGLTVAMSSSLNNAMMAPIAVIELIAMVLSLFLLILTLAVWVVAAIVGSNSSADQQVQTLLDNKSDKTSSD